MTGPVTNGMLLKCLEEMHERFDRIEARFDNLDSQLDEMSELMAQSLQLLSGTQQQDLAAGHSKVNGSEEVGRL